MWREVERDTYFLCVGEDAQAWCLLGGGDECRSLEFFQGGNEGNPDGTGWRNRTEVLECVCYRTRAFFHSQGFPNGQHRTQHEEIHGSPE
jgi:hypothetical protein